MTLGARKINKSSVPWLIGETIGRELDNLRWIGKIGMKREGTIYLIRYARSIF